MSNQKYEITDIAHEKYPFLHRIRALRDIGSEVKAGHSPQLLRHVAEYTVIRHGVIWFFILKILDFRTAQ